jgi:putative transposase
LSKYERILRTGDFVERVLRESEEGMGYRIRPAERDKRIRSVMEEECRKGEVEFEELRMGSRRGKIPRVRSDIAKRLVKELGMSLAEAARLLGVCTSAICRVMKTKA